MRSEWSRLTLGEIANITSSKRIYAREYVDFGVPFYRSKEIIEKSNNQPISTPLFISRDRFDELCIEHGMPKQGDILLTSVGTLGVPYLVKDEEFYFKDGNLTWFQVDSTTSSEFLYYWLLSPEAIMQIDTKHIGSTQKALPIRILNKFKVTYPPFPVQEAIAYTLSCLDKKIELNNKINENLEQQAQTIFKSWFVDFEPFQDGKFVESELGMIPNGWKVARLPEFVEVTYGSAFQSKYFNKEKKGFPLLRIRDLKTRNPQIYTEQELGNQTIIEAGDLVAGMDAEFIPYIWLGEKALMNQRVCRFKYKDKTISNLYTYYLLKPSLEYIQNYKTGTTVSHIGKRDIDNIAIIVPPTSILHDFSNIVKPILNYKIALANQIRTLTNLRDTLLPKLMSGEIEVPVE